MCEARVFPNRREDENLIMRDMVRIEREGAAGNTLVLGTLFGEQKLLGGRIASIDFLAHTIVIEPNVEISPVE
jgi:predicted RNA-binding protein